MYDVFLNMNGSDSLLIVAPVSYMMELLTIEAANKKLLSLSSFSFTINKILFHTLQLYIQLNCSSNT
jgi:hypothetical protein